MSAKRPQAEIKLMELDHGSGFALSKKISVADLNPVPVSSLDPGWVKTRSGSGMNNPDQVSESLETNFLG